MSAQSVPEVIDVQPHPRLLSVLGDIEFAPWQVHRGARRQLLRRVPTPSDGRGRAADSLGDATGEDQHGA